MKTLRKKPLQMYIEPRQDAALSVLSKKKGVSKAELIRESIERYLSTIPLQDDPAMNLVALGKSGKRDLSEKHDVYLAQHTGSPKK